MKPATGEKLLSSKIKKEELQSWCIPYGGLQSDFIIWKFKQLFPNEILADRIKNWPKHTSIALKKAFPNFDLESSNAAALRHQNERQQILDKMKNLIIRKNFSSMSPLKKLEMYENMKYCEFRNEIKGNHEYMKIYFPWLLKKRTYTPKKRSPEKVKKKNLKQKMKKQLRKQASGSEIAPVVVEDWKKGWHPVQPYKFEKPSYQNKKPNTKKGK